MKAYFREIPAVFFSWRGKDIRDFLHRLSTINTKVMKPGDGKHALFLNGSSEVIASFFLYVKSEQDWLAIVAPEESDTFLEYVNKMQFSEDFQMEKREGAVIEYFSELSFAEQKDFLPNFYRKHPDGEGLSFTYLFTWQMDKEQLLAKNIECREEEYFWETLRVRAMVPKKNNEWTTNTKALDIGFLPWIDRNKGCYPGQEVVEKSLNIGHPARALILLQSQQKNSNIDAGLQQKSKHLYHVETKDKVVGEFTSIVYSPEMQRSFALAVVQWSKKDLNQNWFNHSTGNSVGAENEFWEREKGYAKD